MAGSFLKYKILDVFYGTGIRNCDFNGGEWNLLALVGASARP
jgi:hypothetical protein